jgi:hypothetical protein
MNKTEQSNDAKTDRFGTPVSKGQLVIVLKDGFASGNWTPDGFNGGVVVDTDSTGWPERTGLILVEFNSGDRYVYEANQLVVAKFPGRNQIQSVLEGILDKG